MRLVIGSHPCSMQLEGSLSNPYPDIVDLDVHGNSHTADYYPSKGWSNDELLGYRSVSAASYIQSLRLVLDENGMALDVWSGTSYIYR